MRLRIAASGVILEYQASDTMGAGSVFGEVVGRNVSELVPIETSSSVLAGIAVCLSLQSVVRVDYVLHLADGECFRSALFAPVGADEVVAIISDVTEQHHTEARRLHVAEILEASTDYVATTDLNGRILYANGAFRARFGIATAADVEASSFSLFSFMSPDSRLHFLNDGVPELWRTGRWTGEIEGIDASGSLVNLWQAAIVHLDRSGKPEFFSGISRDITTMKAIRSELERSEERSRALLSEGSDVILVLTAEGRVTYASPAMERLLGYPDQSLNGTLAFELIHPDDLDGVVEAFVAAHAGLNAPEGLQYRVRDVEGSWRWVESHTTNHLATPGVGGFIVNARDITARHDAQERIAHASELLASVMGAAASEAILVTDLDATIVAFSRGAEILLGYDAGEVVGRFHPSVFHSPEDIAALAASLGVSPRDVFTLPPPNGKSVVRDWRFIRRDSTTFEGTITKSSRFDASGNLCGFLYVLNDVSDLKRRNAELVRQAHHDPLTGLANRASLEDALNEAATAAEWSSLGRTLLFIDLDRFKPVNDTYGHATGDAVLVGTADRLRANLREADTAFRLGGDEFVVLLGPNVSSEAAHLIAERIVVSVGQPLQVADVSITIGASIGLATSCFELTPDALLELADSAAYTAKRSGRGRVATAQSKAVSVVEPGDLDDAHTFTPNG